MRGSCKSVLISRLLADHLFLRADCLLSRFRLCEIRSLLHRGAWLFDGCTLAIFLQDWLLDVFKRRILFWLFAGIVLLPQHEWATPSVQALLSLRWQDRFLEHTAFWPLYFSQRSDFFDGLGLLLGASSWALPCHSRLLMQVDCWLGGAQRFSSAMACCGHNRCLLWRMVVIFKFISWVLLLDLHLEALSCLVQRAALRGFLALIDLQVWVFRISLGTISFLYRVMRLWCRIIWFLASCLRLGNSIVYLLNVEILIQFDPSARLLLLIYSSLLLLLWILWRSLCSPYLGNLTLPLLEQRAGVLWSTSRWRWLLGGSLYSGSLDRVALRLSNQLDDQISNLLLVLFAERLD